MIRRSLAPLFSIAGLLAGACSPVTAFNALVPKDGGGRLLQAGVPYGAGPRRMLDVFVPRASAGTPRPIIVFFYGGSWASGEREGYRWIGRALAARGYVVAIPDYRLVPEVRYPGFVEDGAAAVRHVAAQGATWGGDPTRIVVAGHSAGAYIAAMLAVDERWLGADRARVRGLVGLAGPYDFAPFDVAVAKAAFGAWPDPSETQPVRWAGAGDPPALLLAGTADQIVRPPQQPPAIIRLLRRRFLGEPASGGVSSWVGRLWAPVPRTSGIGAAIIVVCYGGSGRAANARVSLGRPRLWRRAA
jgi:acetyl esterase/lipase